MVAHIFNLSMEKAEVYRLLGVWGMSGLHSEFQTRQSYIE